MDFEYICLNCKEKGYYFGFGFKTIEYKNQIVLDMPQRHLNGSAISCMYRGWPLFLHSLEISHQGSINPKSPVFSLINAKKGQTLNKFTYQYETQNNNALRISVDQLKVLNPRILTYLDMYIYPNLPYLLLYYGIRNLTGETLTNFHFYQFYDFDIYGREAYKTNCVKYDSTHNMIYQYDQGHGLDTGLIAGVLAPLEDPISHYEGNSPNAIFPSLSHPNLRDIDEFGPEDCAVGLQWTQKQLKPDELRIFPIAIIVGEGQSEFQKSSQDAQSHLLKLFSKSKQSFDEKNRNIIDPKLEKMAFSVTEWCKT